LPFAVYARAHKDYFLERPDQVGAGALETAIRELDLAKLWELVRDGVVANAHTVVDAGKGRVTDYDFGHQALLAPWTLGPLGLGGWVALWRPYRRREDALLRPLVVVVLAFLCGMALTLPIGGFHRLVVVFPWAGLLLAMSLEQAGQALGAFEAERGWRPVVHWGLPLVGAAALVVVNVLALNVMLEKDGRRESAAISRLLVERVAPGAHVT